MGAVFHPVGPAGTVGDVAKDESVEESNIGLADICSASNCFCACNAASLESAKFAGCWLIVIVDGAVTGRWTRV